MEVTRDRTGAVINAIFNDPTVHPLIMNDDRYLDLSKIASDPRGYALIGEPAWGGYILWPVVEAVYELHVGVLPQGRGPWAVDFTASTFQYMFCGTDALELITRIPQGAVGTLALARRFGWRERWRCPQTLYRGQEVPYTVYSLTMFDWLPVDDDQRNAAFARMNQLGMEKKAAVWYQRWALLSSQSGSLQ